MTAPPHDIAAEQACLGACLVDSSAYPAVLEIVGGPGAFYRDTHKDIFAAMGRLVSAGKGVDLVQLVAQMRTDRSYTSESPSYIDSLASICPTSAHAAHYAGLVAKHAFARRLLLVGRQIQSLACEEGEAGPKIEQASRLLAEAYTARDRSQAVHIKTALWELGEQLSERTDFEGNPLPDRENGIPFGFTKLDEVTGGLVPGEITIVAARPAMGKTSFALAVALSAAQHGPVYFWSGEMPRHKIARRVAAMLTNSSPRAVRPGCAFHAVELAPNLWVDDERGIDAARLSAKFSAWMLGHPDCSLLVLDYLSLLADNDQREVSRASRAIMTLSGRHHVPVLELQQLSRRCEERIDKRPVLSDLRESGQLEQDASIVLMLYRDAYYNSRTEQPDLAECWVRKARDGESGKAVRLHFDGPTTRFSDWHDTSATPLRRPAIPELPFEDDGEDYGIPA